jgi:hypothetical protein
MSKEKVAMVKMTEDHFENLSTQKWLEGHYHVYGNLLAFFQTKAAEAFTESKDALAKQLRDDIPKLIKPFFEDQESRAKEHAKNYPYKLIEFDEMVDTND